MIKSAKQPLCRWKITTNDQKVIQTVTICWELPLSLLTRGAQPWLHARITWVALKMLTLGPYSRPTKQNFGGGSWAWLFLRLPTWSPNAAMMKPLMHDSGAFPSALLRGFLQTYVNRRELEFRTLRMRRSFGKGHKKVGTMCCLLSVSRCAPCDCFEELDEKNSPPPKQSRFLSRSNPLSYCIVFPH